MTEPTTKEIADALTGEQAIATVRADPGSVLLQPATWARFLAAIKADLAKAEPDLSSEKGRKAIASAAYKVTQTKTAIDGAARKLKANINTTQQAIIAELDDLAVATRAPLTAWEANEKKRQDLARGIIERIQRLSKIEWNDTSAGVINRLCDVEMIELDPEVFGDALEQAQETLRQAIETMNAAVERLEGEEADKRELERLRTLQAAEDERRAKEAKAQRLADEAEAKRLAEEEALQATPPQSEPTGHVIDKVWIDEAQHLAPPTSEASIAAEAMVIQSDESLDDEAPIVAEKPFIGSPPSGVRQSTVSAPSSPREETHSERGGTYDEAYRALASWVSDDDLVACDLLDAIIAGEIPHVTFNG